MHSILRSDFIKGSCVALDEVESAVIFVLKDVTISTSTIANEEPVATTAFFSQQKTEKVTFPSTAWEINGKSDSINPIC